MKFRISKTFSRLMLKRENGSGFMIIVVASALVASFLSYSLAKLNDVALHGFNNSSSYLKAEQFADSEATLLKATNYKDLVAKSKTAIANSNGFCSEVVLSAESDYSDSVKQRVATVNIYKNINDNNPYYSLNVLKISSELKSSVTAIPVGTIVSWISSTAPTDDGGTWLLCNGQSCTAYPKLKALIGNNVPNLNGRFLEGTTSTPGSTKSAGLPNITGSLNSKSGGNQFSDVTSAEIVYNGALLPIWGSSYNIENRYEFNQVQGFTFDASKSNSIYGASTTVQPASYLVRYYIKAD